MNTHEDAEPTKRTKMRKVTGSGRADTLWSDDDDGDDGKHHTKKAEPEPTVKPSATARLTALAKQAEYFRAPDGKPFATIPMGDHVETWSLKSQEFKKWLAWIHYKAEGKPATGQVVKDVLDVLQAEALFNGPKHPVYVRVARHEEAVYIDLGDDAWRAVEITGDGWRIVDNPPVKFRRTGSMQPLPVPVQGGSLAELRNHLNVTDDGWVLLVAWLVMACRPEGPYPVLNLTGEQGTAKSTTGRMLRQLLDPSSAPLRAEPRDVRDLMIAATNSWVLAYDNLSYLSAQQSDALCRLSTGGGFSTRQLYSDGDETIFEAERPILLTGIQDVAVRNDLIDRSLVVTLSVIPDDRRIPEGEFWQAFDSAAPRILGALYDAVSMAMRNFEDIRLERLPRMADFAKWVVAAEPALPWESGVFLSTYVENRQAAIAVSLEADLVAAAVRTLIEEEGYWSGTATELHRCLEGHVAERDLKSKAWPKSPSALSGRLNRAAPALRSVGIDVDSDRGSDSRTITIQRLAGGPSSPSSSSSHEDIVKPSFKADDRERDTVTPAARSTLPAYLVPFVAEDTSAAYDRTVQLTDDEAWDIWELAGRDKSVVDAALLLLADAVERGTASQSMFEYLFSVLTQTDTDELIWDADELRKSIGDMAGHTYLAGAVDTRKQLANFEEYLGSLLSENIPEDDWDDDNIPTKVRPALDGLDDDW